MVLADRVGSWGIANRTRPPRSGSRTVNTSKKAIAKSSAVRQGGSENSSFKKRFESARLQSGQFMTNGSEEEQQDDQQRTDAHGRHGRVVLDQAVLDRTEDVSTDN